MNKRIILVLLTALLLVIPLLPISPIQVLADNTGAKYPSTKTTQSVSPEDDVDWSNPANIGASDNQRASLSFTYTQISYRLKAQGFDFSVIPDGSTIDGILAEIERYRSGGLAGDYRVQILNASGSLVGDNKADLSSWETVETIKSYGGAVDTWGASPTVAMVKDADFGLVLSVQQWSSLQSSSMYVDCIRITIYYTPPVAPEVDTDACSGITATSMQGNAEITYDGGAEVTRRGFVYAEGLKYALQFNGVSDYMEIPYLAGYYANTAAVENFEWGGDTAPLSDSGGSITWTISVAGTSKAEIDTTQYYLGTRSARFYRDGTNDAYAYFTQTAVTSGQVINFWLRKDDTSRLRFDHGNGSKCILFRIKTDEQIEYYDTAYHDTGVYISKDTWTLLEIRNVNWSAGTYDIYINGVLAVSIPAMRTTAIATNIIDFYNNAGTSEIWLDNILVGSPSTWTWETWINRQDDNATNEYLLSYSSDSDYDRVLQIQSDGTVLSGFKDTSGTLRSVATTDTIPLNTDTHIATSFDGTYIKIYLNGVLEATSSDFSGKIPRNNKYALRVGRLQTSYSFEGLEDELRIWNDVRTPTEIQDNMYSELVGNEVGLVGYWKLNEGSGTTAEDSTSNNNDGTITGADWVYQEWNLWILEDIEQTSRPVADSLYSGLIVKAGQKIPFVNGLINSLSFYIGKSGSPTGDVIFAARDLDGNILGSKVWGDASALQSPPQLEEVEFDSPVEVTGGAIISVEYGGGSIINCVVFKYSNTDVIGGCHSQYTTEWTDKTNYDMAYAIDYEPFIYEDGSFSEGEYSLTIEDLTPDTWYRVRGFAENEVGVGYGDVVVAQTLLTMGYSFGYILGG